MQISKGQNQNWDIFDSQKFTNFKFEASDLAKIWILTHFGNFENPIFFFKYRIFGQNLHISLFQKLYNSKFRPFWKSKIQQNWNFGAVKMGKVANFTFSKWAKSKLGDFHYSKSHQIWFCTFFRIGILKFPQYLGLFTFATLDQ